MFDSIRAYENGLVVVTIGTDQQPDTFLVVSVTGIEGDGATSHWRGVICFGGTQQQCEVFVQQRTGRKADRPRPPSAPRSVPAGYLDLDALERGQGDDDQG